MKHGSLGSSDELFGVDRGNAKKYLEKAPAARFQDHKRVFHKKKVPAATFQHEKHTFSGKKVPAATFQDQKNIFSQKKTPAATFQHKKAVFLEKKGPAATFQDPNPISHPTQALKFLIFLQYFQHLISYSPNRIIL